MAFLKNDKHIHYFALFAIILSLAIRLVNLGNSPLTDYEAGQALKALAIAQNEKVNIGSDSTYLGLSGFSFFIFGSSDFLARFWPSLIGSLMVLVPYLFRKQLGRKTTILLGFILALSPEMVSLSRIIGSPIAGMVFLLMFIGFFYIRRPILAGMSFALGLMSGYSFWLGSFILLVSFLIARWTFDFLKDFQLKENPDKCLFWIRFGLSIAATIIVVGTGFFIAPEGLTSVFGGLYDFIQMFFTLSDAPLVLFLVVFLAYLPAGFLLGLWGSIRALKTKEKLDLFLFVWWVFGVLLILLLLGAQPADLVWVSLPLWVLAVRLMVKALKLPGSGRSVMAVTAIMVIILSIFGLLMVRSSLNLPTGSEKQLSYFIAIIAGVVLMAAVILLIAYGWSREVALSGAMFGLLVVIFTGLISLSMSSIDPGREHSIEVWYPNMPSITSEWATSTIDRVLRYNASGGQQVEIVVANYERPALQWALHKYPDVIFVPYVTPQSQPGIIITPVSESPKISNRYQGQDIVWSRQAQWDTMGAYQYLNWMFTREVTTTQDEMIIWIRSDLMPSQDYLP